MRVIAAALFGMLTASVAMAAGEAEAPAPAAQTRYPAIVVTKVETRELIDRVVATGTVKARDEVYVQPHIEGLSIRTLSADVGDRVVKGAALAVLDDDTLVLQKSQMNATRAKADASIAQFEAQLIEAQANAADADRQRNRAVSLAGKGTVSTSQVEQATAAAATANARVKAAEQALLVAKAELKVVDAQLADIDLNLTRTAVRAPVSGIVSARSANVGAIASGTGQPLFTLIGEGALELVADVSESDILRIAPGQQATVSLAGGQAKLSGMVRLVSPAIDPVSRLGSVRIALDDDARARVGMYGNAEIVIRKTQGLALPLTAVATSGGESSARRVENDIVRLVTVTTGIQDGAFIQIVSGLSAGDDVVAKAGAYVRDGDHIAPVRDASALAN